MAGVFDFFRHKYLLLVLFCVFVCFCPKPTQAQVQVSCPTNIDFALGDFTNWQCYVGTAASVNIKGVTTNVITVNPSMPAANRHVIIPKGNLTDYYGHFPISAPDGSAYCVKLGNDGTGAQAERLTYTFTIPQNQADFQITYQYAIVLEDPGHSTDAQPRFTAKVVDVATGNYITCGAFEYVATANLPGFKKAFGDVIYKEWTPVTLSLAGYQGKQIRLEFTTADCTASGHFGYAYVDVNTYCSNLVTGTDYCLGSGAVTLTGPAGFAKYRWYNADRSVTIDTVDRSIIISPPPPDGTQYNLDIVPYQGFGCNNTVVATVRARPSIVFNITEPPASCGAPSVDITAVGVTKGNDANLKYTYWKDSVATVSLLTPEAVTTTGTFYIRAFSPSGCSEIKPVHTLINNAINFNMANPPTTCLGTTTDLTAAALVNTASPNLTYTYWRDAKATLALPNPDKVAVAGTYYVQGYSPNACVLVQPVQVSFYAPPKLTITSPQPVCYPNTVDVTQPAVTQGSDANLNFTYWLDSLATAPLLAPNSIPKAGVYYVKAVNPNGCQTVRPVTVSFNPLPQLTVNTPPEVCIPDVVDITLPAVTTGSTDVAALSYWANASATLPLALPTAVADSGVYYIKATNKLGCEFVQPVTVIIHKLPVLYLTPPRKIYKPGTSDITVAAITKGSSPGLALSYWRDTSLTVSVTSPKAINNSGTVFVKAVNKYGCYTIKRMDVVVADIPDIQVPTAFTPTQLDNNKLFPFLTGIQTFKLFRVYNKWGDIVYQTNDVTKGTGWNGSYKNSLTFMETYTWVAEGYDYVGNIVHKTGNTILLK